MTAEKAEKSIDIYEDIIAVGAYFDDQINNNSGAVYLYEKINNNWISINSITSVDAYANDNFGLSLSLYDDWLAVGSIDDDNGVNSGSAYIYHKESEEYIEKIKIVASDGSEYDRNKLCSGTSWRSFRTSWSYSRNRRMEYGCSRRNHSI